MSGCEEEAAAVIYGISAAYKQLIDQMESIEDKYNKHLFSIQDVEECITRIVSGETDI